MAVNMKLKLGDLELPQVQEVTTYDRRALAEHKPPGMAGSLFQNLGRQPTGIILWGVATGPNARKFAENLDGKFRAAKPVPFSTDMIAGAGISQMLITDLRLEDLAGKPNRFSYVLALSEFIKPAKTGDQSALDSGIRSDAKNRTQQLTSKLTKPTKPKK
jgi:hypothetical protein